MLQQTSIGWELIQLWIFLSPLNHNFLPGLLIVSGRLMSFHYLTVIELYGGCAGTVATGKSGTGKSTSILASHALNGCAHNGIFQRVLMLEC